MSKSDAATLAARRLETSVISGQLQQIPGIIEKIENRDTNYDANHENIFGIKTIIDEYYTPNTIFSIILTISPSFHDAQSTLSTLQFGEDRNLCQMKLIEHKQDSQFAKQQNLKQLTNNQNKIQNKSTNSSKNKSNSKKTSQHEMELLVGKLTSHIENQAKAVDESNGITIKYNDDTKKSSQLKYEKEMKSELLRDTLDHKRRKSQTEGMNDYNNNIFSGGSNLSLSQKNGIQRNLDKIGKNGKNGKNGGINVAGNVIDKNDKSDDKNEGIDDLQKRFDQFMAQSAKEQREMEFKQKQKKRESEMTTKIRASVSSFLIDLQNNFPNETFNAMRKKIISTDDVDIDIDIDSNASDESKDGIDETKFDTYDVDGNIATTVIASQLNEKDINAKIEKLQNERVKHSQDVSLVMNVKCCGLYI